MLIVFDAHSGVPVYRQLMDQIKFHIATGLLKTGDELPSTRALSADMKVNPMTVSKAYNLLEREGVVERRPGLSVVVAQAGAAQALARKLDRLRHALKPIAVTIRQLDIDPEDALTVLEDLLDTAPKRKGLRR
jgi:GntR family transcriptional regulator